MTSQPQNLDEELLLQRPRRVKLTHDMHFTRESVGAHALFLRVDRRITKTKQNKTRTTTTTNFQFSDCYNSTSLQQYCRCKHTSALTAFMLILVVQLVVQQHFVLDLCFVAVKHVLGINYEYGHQENQGHATFAVMIRANAGKCSTINITRVLAENLGGLGFSQSVSYIKSIPTHEKSFAAGKSDPNATFNLFFLGWVRLGLGSSSVS